MSFQPVVPLPGYAGWRFLTRTAETQKTALAETPLQKRDADAFRSRIGSVTSAEALVSDRQLLKVALGAFGLDDDLPNKAFIRKVLEGNPADPRALVNRLADKRYLEFAQAFGFASIFGPNTIRAGFADRIVAAYETRQFEVAIGNQNEDMRLALGAARELESIAGRSSSEDTLWLTVMGLPPVRKVFETALGLPASFGSIDLDQQLGVLKEKTARTFGDGSVRQFADPARREELIKYFLLRSQAQQTQATGSASTALALLQGAAGGGSGALALLQAAARSV